MLSLFCLRKYTFTIFIGQRSLPHVVPHLCSTAQSFKVTRQSTSFSIYCGPPVKVLLPYRHPLSRIGSWIINFRQSRSPAALGNVSAGLYCRTKLYYTGPKATEAANLQRWDIWSSPRNLRRKQIIQYFNLRYISRILDKILLHGLSGNRMVLRWVETSVRKTDWLSRTTLISDAKGEPYVLVEVMKPVANGPWTHAIIQECLEAMLFEMAKMYFLMYSRNCGLCDEGHPGSSFRKLLRRVEEEANRILEGFPRPWQLRNPRK